jgi:hypothetical protein
MIKKIDGYENYFIDAEGNVYRKLTPANKKGDNGYDSLVLSENGKLKTHMIHRLVAKTFIDNPDNLPVVNHIDENKLNNNLSNLEWCSQKDNVQKHLSRGNNPIRNYRECFLYKDDLLIGEFKSISEACRFASKNYEGISEYVLNKHRQSKGFKVVKKV